MTQPLLTSTIGTQSRSVKFLTIKTVVRKATARPRPGAQARWCFRKAGGASQPLKSRNWKGLKTYFEKKLCQVCAGVTTMES